MFKNIITMIIYVFSISPLNAQSPAWNRANVMGKGANLSNWLEAGWLGNAYPDENYYQKTDLEFLKSIGIQTIRLPVIFEWLADENPPYVLDTNHTSYQLVDAVIQWCDELGLNLILVNHHGRDLNDANYGQQIPLITSIWRQMIMRYHHLNPNQYIFEIRNEPDNNISNPNLRIVQQAIIDTIRSVNQTHTLIMGANWWNAGWSLVQTVPYADSNIIYTFHNYSPFEFTHQGFGWSGLPAGVTFPATPSDEANIRSELVDIKKWSTQHNVPVFLGEFGVSIYADLSSRCNWIGHMGHLVDSLNMPWFYWDILHSGESFGFLENDIQSSDRIIPCFGQALGLGEAALSMEFLDFHLEEKPQAIQLLWQVQDLEMGEYFEIWKAIDGASFYKIHVTSPFVSKRAGPQILTYLDPDKPVNVKAGYYKLVAKDADGIDLWSKIEMIHFTKSALLQWEQNKKLLRISQPEPALIRILDIGGRIRKEFKSEAGSSAYLLDDLPVGFYIVNWGNHTFQDSRKIVIAY